MGDETASDQPTARHRGLASRPILIAVLLALAAVAWVASGSFPDAQSDAGPKDAATPPKDAQPIAVQVMDLKAVPRPHRVIVTGHTEAVDDAQITAETSGRVVAVPVRKGVNVSAGKVLVELAMNDRGARLKNAEAKVDAMRITFQAARNLQRKQFETEIKLAESTAALADAEATLAAIQKEIQDTKIKAPIDGYVEHLLPSVGDYVAAGETVALIVDLDPLRVVAYLSERDIADVAIDDLASITLPGGRAIGGSVQYISKQAEGETRTFRIDIWIDNPSNTIPAGQTAEVELHIGNRKGHQVPSSALTLNEQGALGVRTVDATDTVRFMPVKILDDTPDGVWIGGLPDEVRVITLGQEFVTEGAKVRPVATPPLSGAS